MKKITMVAALAVAALAADARLLPLRRVLCMV